jgi:CheY-like chemotaxis protein
MKSAQKTILIVDDEPEIVLAIVTILSDAGYSVASATRRESLMQRLGQGSLPDLILLDMLLSG